MPIWTTPKQMNLLMQHDAGIERYRKPTRRDMFLAEMDRAVPRAELCAVIARDYPKAPVSEVGVEPAMGVALDSIVTVWGRSCD